MSFPVPGTQIEKKLRALAGLKVDAALGPLPVDGGSLLASREGTPAPARSFTGSALGMSVSTSRASPDPGGATRPNSVFSMASGAPSAGTARVASVLGSRPGSAAPFSSVSPASPRPSSVLSGRAAASGAQHGSVASSREDGSLAGSVFSYGGVARGGSATPVTTVSSQQAAGDEQPDSPGADSLRSVSQTGHRRGAFE